MSEKIEATLIIEMVGKPADHLQKTMSEYLEKIGAENGVKILKKKINDAKAIPDSELFSNFAEIEIEVVNLSAFILLLFSYLPSHVEIIKPASLGMNNFDLNALCNEVVRRLHAYDSIAKNVLFEKRILEEQLIQHGITPATKQPQKPVPAEAGKKKKRAKKKRL